MEKASNETLARIQKEMQFQNEILKSQQQKDVETLTEKLREFKRTAAKNQWGTTNDGSRSNIGESQQQESREMQLIREMKDSFTAAIRELNVKVMQREDSQMSLESELNSLKETLMAVTESSRIRGDNLVDLQSQVDGMLAEAMASAALATKAMSNNQSAAEQTIVRLELRKVQASLNAEVQSRLKLEQVVETIQMNFNDFRNQRLTSINERTHREQSTLKQLEENGQQLKRIFNQQERFWKELEQIQNFATKNDRSIIATSNEVINLNSTVQFQLQSMIWEQRNETRQMLDNLERQWNEKQENVLMESQREWVDKLNDASSELKSNLLQRLEALEVSNDKSEVKELKERVDHFVQSLTKVLRLPSHIRDLETRMHALEEEQKSSS